MASFDDKDKVKKGFDPRISLDLLDPEAEAEGTADKKYDKKYKGLSYAKYCSPEGIDLKSKKYKPKNLNSCS